MKWIMVLLLSSCAWGQFHEILRPTADVDGGEATAKAIDPTDCNTSTYNASSALPHWWDNAGLSTSDKFELTNISTGAGRCSARGFITWGSTANTYTSLTLNINTLASCSGACGVGSIAYTIDGSHTWTVVKTGTLWSQFTATISLSPGQDLTKLAVAVVVFANPNDGVNNGDMSVTGADVWTDGIYTPPATPTPIPPSAPATQQPSIISRLIRRIQQSLNLQ